MTNIKDKIGRTSIEYANEKMKDFIIRQMLKRHIETYSWENGNLPLIALKQKEFINQLKADDKTNWSEALEKIISMAKPDKQISILNQPLKSSETQDFLSWFISKENLLKNVSAFDKYSKASEERTKFPH